MATQVKSGLWRRVVLLSYEFWKCDEGGNPNIVGKRYQMNDRLHNVIGVLPPMPAIS
jgi:putative ABC transport system permease protein